jgi:hypothetical protein
LPLQRMALSIDHYLSKTAWRRLAAPPSLPRTRAPYPRCPADGVDMYHARPFLSKAFATALRAQRASECRLVQVGKAGMSAIGLDASNLAVSCPHSSHWAFFRHVSPLGRSRQPRGYLSPKHRNLWQSRAWGGPTAGDLNLCLRDCFERYQPLRFLHDPLSM